MTRQLVGAVFCGIAALLYATRHVGAAVIVSTKTGDQREAYSLLCKLEAQSSSVSASSLC